MITSIYLLYFAQESKYNNYLPTIQSMLNSFKTFVILPYESFDLEIGIDYPSHWNKNIKERMPPGFLYIDPVSSLVLSSSEENVRNDSTTKLEIYSFKLYKIITIDEAVNETVKTYQGYGIKSLNGFQLIDSKSTDWIKMNPSHMLNYSYIDSTNRIINNTEIITIQNGKEYHIIFSAEEKDYLTYLDDIHNIISSFKIFSTLPYDKQFDKYSAITLRYPNTYPWEPQDIDNKTIQLSSSSDNNFTISVFPFNKSLPEITKELIADYKQKKINFISLENSTTSINTTLGTNIPANKITFSYYNPDIGEQINEMQTYAVFKDKLYLLSYSASEYSYDESIATVNGIIDSFKITEHIQYNDNDFKHMQYGLIKDIIYPSTWSNSSQDLALFFQAPPENNTTINKYNETLMFSVGAAGTSTLEELVGNDINIFKKTYANFSLIESQRIPFGNNSAHKIVYTYKEYDNDSIFDNNAFCKCEKKEMIIYTIINNKIFAIGYSAEFDKFFTYLPTIEKIIDSIDIEQGSPLGKKKSFGLPMNGSPVDLAINYVTNKLYIAVPDARYSKS